jgi:hypothetical protein
MENKMKNKNKALSLKRKELIDEAERESIRVWGSDGPPVGDDSWIWFKQQFDISPQEYNQWYDLWSYYDGYSDEEYLAHLDINAEDDPESVNSILKLVHDDAAVITFLEGLLLKYKSTQISWPNKTDTDTSNVIQMQPATAASSPDTSNKAYSDIDRLYTQEGTLTKRNVLLVLKDAGLACVPVTGWLRTTTETSKIRWIEGEFYDALEAFKLSGATYLYMYMELVRPGLLNATIYKNNKGELGTFDVDLGSVHPPLAPYRIYEGSLSRICLESPSGQLAYSLESSWWSDFVTEKDIAQDILLTKNEAAQFAAEHARERAEKKQMQELEASLELLLKDAQFTKLKTEASIIEYAKMRYPGLNVLAPIEVKRVIRTLRGKLAAGLALAKQVPEIK